MDFMNLRLNMIKRFCVFQQKCGFIYVIVIFVLLITCHTLLGRERTSLLLTKNGKLHDKIIHDYKSIGNRQQLSKKEEYVVGSISGKKSHQINMENVNVYSRVKTRNIAETVPDITYRIEDLVQCPDNMDRRLPTALIAGVRKGGSTSLLKFLSVHPEIAARIGTTKGQTTTAFFTDKTFNTKIIEWYRNLMPCSFSLQISIERSPSYFDCTMCPINIYTINPDMKMIMILKDPIDRDLSHYLMNKAKDLKSGENNLPNTFEESMTTANGTTVDAESFFVKLSRYDLFAAKWLRVFSRNQLLFLDGHNFILNPTEELQKVEDFLGIDRYFTPDMFALNKLGKYCLVDQDGELDCLQETKGGRTHPKINETVKLILQDYFRPFNEDFFKLIKQRFEWGY